MDDGRKRGRGRRESWKKELSGVVDDREDERNEGGVLPHAGFSISLLGRSSVAAFNDRHRGRHPSRHPTKSPQRREESARDVSIDSLTADLWSDSQASEPVPRARVARHTPRRLCRGRDANGPCHRERLNLWRSDFKDRDVGFLAGESSLFGNSFLMGVGRFLSKGNDGARC